MPIHEELRRHIEQIVPLTDDEFLLTASHFSVQKCKRNDFLIQRGEKVKYTYFVISGLLKLLYYDEDGKEHILSFAMEDWWETDFQAFYASSNATMSLQCLEKTIVLRINLKDYVELCRVLPKMVNFFLRKSTSGHISAQQRILSLLSANAKERYDQLLYQYPSLFQRVSKTLIASYLGVSRETLSRMSK